MESVTTFFKDHWKAILIGLSVAVFSVLFNNYLRGRENAKLLVLLTEELKQLQDKPQLTQEEKNQIQYLKGEIYILKFKCLA